MIFTFNSNFGKVFDASFVIQVIWIVLQPTVHCKTEVNVSESNANFKRHVILKNECICAISKEETVCYGRPKCHTFPTELKCQTKTFRLDATLINRIEKGATSNLTLVQSLKIENNQNLTLIENEAFMPMENLQNLSICSNQNLRFLLNGSMAGLKNLKYLFLLKNGFEELKEITPALSWIWLPNLQKLYLNENSFKQVAKSDFDLMLNSTVEEIHLVLCDIETMESDSFINLKHLKMLGLGHNIFGNNISIVSRLIEETVNFAPLERISLFNIRLVKSPPVDLIRAIANSNISNLNLARNQFGSITNETFSILMPKLETLDLSDCFILKISADSFVRIPNLKTLYLRGNELSVISDRILLSQLKFLDLKFNWGKKRKYSFNLFGHQFVEMGNLQHLQLSFNNIRAIYNQSFIGLKNLLTLSLENAGIYFIKSKSFEHLKNLLILNLKDNNINHGALTEGTFDGLDNLSELHLDGCGIKVLNNTESLFGPLKKLQYLGLARNNLLHLNDLYLPPTIIKLDLSQNRLKPWNLVLFESENELKSLNLNSNKLVYLTQEMLADFHSLNDLNLERNPFSCHCSSHLIWTNGKLINLTKDQSILCVSPEKYNNLTIQEFYKTIYCEIFTLHLIILISCLALCFFAIAGTIFYYRWYFRYWIFLARLYLIRKGRQISKSKIKKRNFVYDAFISYSNEDQNFVVRLVGMLERHPPFLKLCVYERDFEVGSIISQSVVESVEQSRKTVLIMSDSYAKSQWCQWESQIAEYHRLFLSDDEQDGLILIKLGPISKVHLTPTLKFLLKTRIYLQWDSDVRKQKEFWEKLRKVLASPAAEFLENTHL